ncbi:DUF4880 domain-containing protein [Zestomonas carbonaria]|uniref:DUF4880 domain-containing protein n=1 Tax=Zestomonas carbonaria TaxID=2762745 RepID=UPI001656E9E1|nr:DUF4880 domain-containing protein [Pseudomonas carbonaria]
MRNHDNLTDTEIFARAVDLLLKITDEPDEPAHARNLAAWLDASPRHRAALVELDMLWEATGEVLSSVRNARE